MKKLLLILPVVALAACGKQQPNEFVANCEKVDSDNISITYKCPITEELAAIQAMEPVVKFVGTVKFGYDGLKEYAADTEHVYVNFAALEKCDTKGQVSYRVMVKNPVLDGNTMYAVGVCR